jgi:hypothetical protein
MRITSNGVGVMIHPIDGVRVKDWAQTTTLKSVAPATSRQWQHMELIYNEVVITSVGCD